MELDDVLSDKEPEKKEPEEKPEGALAEIPEDMKYTNRRKEHRKKEYTAQGRDPETGQFAPKAEPAKEPEAKDSPKEPEKKAEPEKTEPKTEPVKEELTAKERALLHVAHDERTKRQTIERELAELRAGKGTAKEPETPKAFWDDPEGALAKHRQEIDQTVVNTRLSTAEMIARSKYQDFDQEAGVFAEMVRTVPGLYQQWMQSSDPAEFAYRTGKFNRELREAGGLAQLREKIERETRVKVEAEMKSKEEVRLAEIAKKRAELPGSLSDARGISTQNRVEWTGPTPLENILGK